jgi:tetratricopeptide (TPR) repeat protein
VLTAARRYSEAIAAHQEALALNPDSVIDHAFLGLAYSLLGDLRNAQSHAKSNAGTNGFKSFSRLATKNLGRMMMQRLRL